MSAVPHTITAKPQYCQLPSFDELLESIEHPSEPSMSLAHPIPFNHPRKSPSYASHHVEEEGPLAGTFRPPSTPPSRSPNSPRTRGRASSAPSSLDMHLGHGMQVRHRESDEISPRAVLSRRDGSCDGYGRALGLTRRLSHEHYGDRVQEIKDGDGEWMLNDIVSPDILPPRARPHFHGRHYSTTSLPPISKVHIHSMCPREEPTASTLMVRSSVHEDDRDKRTSRVDHHHSHSFGSQSPLSTCNPLTPRSISGSFIHQMTAKSENLVMPGEVWQRQKAREMEEDLTEEVGIGKEDRVMIPSLPQMF